MRVVLTSAQLVIAHENRELQRSERELRELQRELALDMYDFARSLQHQRALVRPRV